MKKTILIALIFCCSKIFSQQVIDTVVFQLHAYVTANACSPYPHLADNFASLFPGPTGFLNVMNFGATGNGTTDDGNAIRDCFVAANSGAGQVYFPPGKTFLFTSQKSINISRDITVWAYGATLRQKDLTGYGMLEFLNNTLWTHSFVWLGGIIDGNQFNQKWLGNPHGGIYDDTITAGATIDIDPSGFDLALFKDVKLINTSITGLCAINCRIGMFEKDSAYNGAATGSFGGIQPQGTYFKVRGQGGTPAKSAAFYCNSIDCDGSQFALHYSTVTGAVPDNAVTVINNCHVTGASSCFHSEDCTRDIIVNSRFGGGGFFISQPSLEVIAKNNTFTGTRLNLGEINSGSRRLALVTDCTFSGSGSYGVDLKGNNLVCYNNTFTGSFSTAQAVGSNFRKCTFNSFGSLAINNGFAIDSCNFNNGVRPANLISGGFVTTSCVFTNVSNPNTKSNPSTTGWKQIFLSELRCVTSTGIYLTTFRIY